MQLLSWMHRKSFRSSTDTQASASSCIPAIQRTTEILRKYQYLKAGSVLEFDRFKSHQELQRDGGSHYHTADQPPALIIFVSHRWESTAHPDPDGRQLAAIQYILKHIPVVAASLQISGVERRRLIPSIRVHGLIQSAIIVGARDKTDNDYNVWGGWGKISEITEPNALLNNVGIWYDYSCISPEVAVEDSQQEMLIGLPDLVRSVPILILRDAGDDYAERGWCAAELAAAARDVHIIVARVDLIGQGFTDDDLHLTQKPENEVSKFARPSSDQKDSIGDFEEIFSSPAIFRMPLDQWESDADKISLWNLYIGFPGLKVCEENRAVPFFTTGRNPQAFPQQKDLLIYFQGILREMAENDERNGMLSPPVDLALITRSAMASAGLKCSLEWDFVLVGLSILRSRHSPKLVPTLAQFYQTAIERWVARKSLRLTRYRHKTPFNYGWEAWYLFEDEEPSSRPSPRWARKSGKQPR